MPLPLIIPHQSVPPTDDPSKLFNKTWWLFFNNLSSAIAERLSSFIARNSEPIFSAGEQVKQGVGELQGDHISVRTLGAKGDTRVATGAVSSGATTLTITAGAFAASDVGKTITVLGAGAAGFPLGTTIAVVLSSTRVTLATAALTTAASARVEWGTDDTAAINAGLDLAKDLGCGLLIPWGRYTVSDALLLMDAVGVTVFGQGDSSVIVPSGAWPASTDLFEISGSVGVKLLNFKIDGILMIKNAVAVEMTAIYGDGTATNPNYGQIEVTLTIANWQQQGIGVGANSPNTVSDIDIVGCQFPNFGSTLFGAHPIDTGSSGTKERYRIIRNRIVWGAYTAVPPANGIFVGHGINEDFVIAGNIGKDCPADFIQVFGRPFTNEPVSFRGVTIYGNVADTPGHSGIAVYGATGVAITGNEVTNPGTHGASAENKSAILLSHGTSVSTNYACSDICIQGNVLIDTRGGGALMSHGCMDSHAAGLPASGEYGLNVVRGQTLEEFKVSPDDATGWRFITGTGKNIGLGRLTAEERIDCVGNILARLPSNNNVFLSASIEGIGASPFFSSLGSIRYNPVTDRWNSVYDGVVNGFSAVLFSTVDGAIRLISEASTGGTQRVYTQAAFGALVKAILTGKTNGMRWDSRVGFGKDPDATNDVLMSLLQVDTSAKLGYATINRPVMTDGAKGLISGSPDVNNANHILATSFGSGDYAQWNGSKFIPGAGGSSLPVVDTTAIAKGSADATKLVRFEVDGLTAGATRVVTVPDEDVTIAKNAYLEGIGTSNPLVLTTSLVDVAGATVTLNRDGIWLIIGIFALGGDASTGSIIGALTYDGTPQTDSALLSSGGGATDATVSQTWVISNTGSKVARLQARKSIAAGTGNAYLKTKITAIFLYP